MIVSTIISQKYVYKILTKMAIRPIITQVNG